MGHVRGAEKRQQPQFNFHFNLYVLHSHHFNFNLELTIEACSEWLFMSFPTNPLRGVGPLRCRLIAMESGQRQRQQQQHFMQIRDLHL